MTKCLGQPPFMFAIFSAISFLSIGNEATADTTLISRTSNGKLFKFFSDEKVLPQAIVNAIVDQTPSSVGFLTASEETQKDWLGNEHGPLYGLGFCSRILSRDDCTHCLQSARFQLFQECSKRGVGAQIHLKDCYIRYETYQITDVK